MGEKQNIYVGTCGWVYQPDWVDIFYPNFLASSLYLEYYSSIFNSVEIDSSFYYTPKRETVEKWCYITPNYFRFSAKINQKVTHIAKLDLRKCKNDLIQYLENFLPMEAENKLIAHLIQLPPSFSYEEKKDKQNFEDFISFWLEWRESRGRELLGDKTSKNSWQGVVEFRNKTWIRDSIMDLLSDYQIGYCAVVEPLLPPTFINPVKDLLYLRFHGYGKNPWWNYLFNDTELNQWARKISIFHTDNPSTKIAAYFNNHFSGYAVKNALDILPKLNLKPQQPVKLVQENFRKKHKSKKRYSPSPKNKNPNLSKKNRLDNWFQLK
ncbi:MAG: DUF72 domain-containing protein [Candidatus Lokiarchaeota archaeon]|nr:DUF72 domain-containing protein [Candidatus Harpocratesius repetitus]